MSETPAWLCPTCSHITSSEISPPSIFENARLHFLTLEDPSASELYFTSMEMVSLVCGFVVGFSFNSNLVHLKESRAATIDVLVALSTAQGVIQKEEGDIRTNTNQDSQGEGRQDKDGKGKDGKGKGDKGKDGKGKGGKGKGGNGKSTAKGGGKSHEVKAPMKVKTKAFCKFFSVDRCKKGDQCQYSHNIVIDESKRDASRASKGGNGKSTAKGGGKSHEVKAPMKVKTKAFCKFFSVDRCKKGDQCQYSHNIVIDESKRDASRASAVNNNQIICASETCPKFAPVLCSTKTCKDHCQDTPPLRASSFKSPSQVFLIQAFLKLV